MLHREACNTCSSITAEQTLTVDHHGVDAIFAVDGVADATREVSVVLFLQWANNQRPPVSSNNHTLALRQRVTIFQPIDGLHDVRHHLAAEVGRAVASNEDSIWTLDFSTCNALFEN